MSLPSEIQDLLTELEPLHQVAHQVMQVLSDPDHGISDLARVLEVDAALTVDLLRIANSPAFSPRQPVTSVVRAINLLGEKLITILVMRKCTKKVMHKELTGYAAGSDRMWHHSLLTALAARELAFFQSEPANPGQAYTAGLLHDIGKIVTSDLLEGVTGKMVSAVDNDIVPNFAKAEEREIGASHCQVGELVCRKWDLPEAICTSVRYHHSPMECPETWRPLAFTVHVADSMAMMSGEGTGVDCLLYELDSRFTDYLDLPSGAFEQTYFQTQMQYRDLMELLGH